MKIYLLRHGETAFNAQGMVQGRGIDAPLNHKGEQQALAFFNYYKHLPFDHVYTSALMRTSQTIKNFKKLGIPYTALSGLDEISWGVYEGKPFATQFQTAYEHLLNSWKNGLLHVKAPEGESPLEVWTRQIPVVSHWLASNHKQILVCMHGRAMRILLSLICQTPLAQMDVYTHTNTGLYVLDFNSFPAIIELKNDISHLAI